MSADRDGGSGSGHDRVTAEHPAPSTRATGEHALSHTAEHTTSTRATPLGAMSVRGDKRVGLRLFGVAAMDQHQSAATPFAAGTELVTFRDLGAVVSPGPYAADHLVPRDLDVHCAVVGEVFERRAIVPAPPGTVFRSRERLLGWLELHYYTLAEALDFVTDRAVARVTVRRGDPNTVHAAATGVPPATLRLTPAGDEASAVAGDLVSLAADAFRELRRDAVALIVLRAGPDAAQPDSEAHGSFLIERSRWATFVDAVALQGRRHAALRMECSGPWPPFDFVRMQFTT
ncbi:Gas vesicle synthesis GvpLGvpF [Gemmatirosa kalamazoonensis]|uniref:Gas vesicle synthesis GvpLGvpF n=1 Tax=Gemmatirosa kalamazoonensis TaxID=861299 RepID=W0RGX9_9BACT|nr:Gas vesicle synthesis GvpLGvpF [Gemmatirosa kalamazoonensis]